MSNSSSSRRRLRLGTRGSRLARWQADWVANRLRHFGHAVDVVEIATRGDKDPAAPIADIGAPGVFTKQIQHALLAGEVDLAVHSLKDLPTEPVAGLALAAVPPRESPADVLVGRAGSTEQGAASNSLLHAPCSVLPLGARVGTGSLRRQAQLRHARPDLQVENVRGNVETRIRKLDDGQCDALVLAEAGLKRLGLADRISEILNWDVMLPAVGQGALGIECRSDDADVRRALELLDDAATRAAVLAERSLLAHLRGGCLAPIGALGQIETGRLHLSAVVLNPDGSRRLAEQDSALPEEGELLGGRVADALLGRGAAELIAASRSGLPT